MPEFLKADHLPGAFQAIGLLLIPRHQAGHKRQSKMTPASAIDRVDTWRIMTHQEDSTERDQYAIHICVPRDLSKVEMKQCEMTICEGGAVDRGKAAKNIPRARVLVIVRCGKTIVGVGAIKRIQRRHTSDVAERSGYPLDPATPELGYVAVSPKHRHKGLSGRILAALAKQHQGPLFATTDDTYMKKTLLGVGFVNKGRTWKGQRGILSLWIRK